MDDLKIGPVEERDREELAKVFRADMRALGPTHDEQELLPLVDAIIAEHGDHSFSWVARSPDGQIAGVILAFPFWSLKVANRALWIEALYVQPHYRRSGIGAVLLDFLLDWAEDHQYKAVEVEAYRMNTAASILFRETGFRRLAHERYSYRVDEMDWDSED